MRRLPPIGRPELAGVAAGITCAAVALAAVVAIEVDARSTAAAAESVAAAPAAHVDTCTGLVTWYRSSSPIPPGAQGALPTTDAVGRMMGDPRWQGILLPHTGLRDPADTAASPLISLAYIPAPATSTDAQVEGALRTMRAAIEYMPTQGMPLSADLRARADRIARECPAPTTDPPPAGSR